ncbi:L-histidine N(alpha)-methyltransferase [Herminiimonas fonticola]|uniref:Dimethylhistidine N-methyltransferase n=1 Tax=Herminiimonas fonticola TaxID=303380 RepID=A0A4V3BWC7_9BURK|nr:L-histidine N(alpha)-methyltransferase [Herminiimonas fonticola]RBA25545.1 dimethylhistidine N-methyltransferase [Herminiimonas fonticola]TDN94658.1 dimethylhistidine N-methyltransferase [Herminiimonas fonticola]
MAQFIQLVEQRTQCIDDELVAGLTATQATTSPKYLYDALGSKLFEAICELPEYYPTRTEAKIFGKHAQEMAQAIGLGTTLIDLGAGNCAKAANLFPCLQPAQYVPIDISVEFLRDSVNKLQQQFPDIDMVGVGMDFSVDLRLPKNVRSEKRLFFYPGSSIGNFMPDDALVFLRQIKSACMQGDVADGGLLIGVDLVKENSILDAAYDDVLGVTASFNLNLLLHLNRLLDADFDLREWRHRGFFNDKLSRIEMHLEALSDQTVRWPNGVRRFERGERIHTENSYKYTRQSFISLLTEAGFENVTTWTDPQQWFMVCHARAA